MFANRRRFLIAALAIAASGSVGTRPAASMTPGCPESYNDPQHGDGWSLMYSCGMQGPSNTGCYYNGIGDPDHWGTLNCDTYQFFSGGCDQFGCLMTE
jgi:hypothetical protein